MVTGNAGGMGASEVSAPQSPGVAEHSGFNRLTHVIRNLAESVFGFLAGQLHRATSAIPTSSTAEQNHNTYWAQWMISNRDNPSAERVHAAILHCSKASQNFLNLEDCTNLDIDFAYLPPSIHSLGLSGLPKNLNFSSAGSLTCLVYKQKPNANACPVLSLPAGLKELRLHDLKAEQLQLLPDQLEDILIVTYQLQEGFTPPNSQSSLSVEDGKLDSRHWNLTDIPTHLLSCVQTLGLKGKYYSTELLETALQLIPVQCDLYILDTLSPRAHAALVSEFGLHHETPQDNPSTQGFNVNPLGPCQPRAGLTGELENWISLIAPRFRLSQAHEQQLKMLSESQQVALSHALQSLDEVEGPTQPHLEKFRLSPFRTTLEIGETCRQLLDNPQLLLLYAHLSQVRLLSSNLLAIGRTAKLLADNPKALQLFNDLGHTELTNLNPRAIDFMLLRGLRERSLVGEATKSGESSSNHSSLTRLPLQTGTSSLF